MSRVLPFARTASKLCTGVAKSVTSKRRMYCCGNSVPANSTTIWLPCWRRFTGVRGSLKLTTTRPVPSLPRRKSSELIERPPVAPAEAGRDEEATAGSAAG